MNRYRYWSPGHDQAGERPDEFHEEHTSLSLQSVTFETEEHNSIACYMASKSILHNHNMDADDIHDLPVAETTDMAVH